MDKMSKKRAIEILQIEKTCVGSECDRNCSECHLVMEEQDIIQAIDIAIEVLSEKQQTDLERLTEALDEFEVEHIEHHNGILFRDCKVYFNADGSYRKE